MLSINWMNVNKVDVAKFLVVGLYVDSHLNRYDHINVTRKLIAKNVPVMYEPERYCLYCAPPPLILPHLNYCCETWGKYLQKPTLSIVITTENRYSNNVQMQIPEIT